MSDNHAQTADPTAIHGIDDMAEMTFAPDPVTPAETKRSAMVSWLIRDIAYIAMLLLALIGVGFRLPVSYWLVLFPLFGSFRPMRVAFAGSRCSNRSSPY